MITAAVERSSFPPLTDVSTISNSLSVSWKLSLRIGMVIDGIVAAEPAPTVSVVETSLTCGDSARWLSSLVPVLRPRAA